jgi:hypothetical protein
MDVGMAGARGELIRKRKNLVRVLNASTSSFGTSKAITQLIDVG